MKQTLPLRHTLDTLRLRICCGSWLGSAGSRVMVVPGCAAGCVCGGGRLTAILSNNLYHEAFLVWKLVALHTDSHRQVYQCVSGPGKGRVEIFTAKLSNKPFPFHSRPARNNNPYESFYKCYQFLHKVLHGILFYPPQ